MPVTLLAYVFKLEQQASRRERLAFSVQGTVFSVQCEVRGGWKLSTVHWYLRTGD